MDNTVNATNRVLAFLKKRKATLIPFIIVVLFIGALMWFVGHSGTIAPTLYILH